MEKTRRYFDPLLQRQVRERFVGPGHWIEVADEDRDAFEELLAEFLAQGCPAYAVPILDGFEKELERAEVEVFGDGS